MGLFLTLVLIFRLDWSLFLGFDLDVGLNDLFGRTELVRVLFDIFGLRVDTITVTRPCSARIRAIPGLRLPWPGRLANRRVALLFSLSQRRSGYARQRGAWIAPLVRHKLNVSAEVALYSFNLLSLGCVVEWLTFRHSTRRL